MHFIRNYTISDDTSPIDWNLHKKLYERLFSEENIWNKHQPPLSPYPVKFRLALTGDCGNLGKCFIPKQNMKEQKWLKIIHCNTVILQ